jgi:PAS domain S-box-containing protein
MSRRKSSEDGSTPEQAMLEAAEQIAQMGSYELVPETGERRWSDNLFRILGLEPGEIEPSREFLLERVHPDDRAAIERAAERFERTGEVTSPMDYRFVRPDGEMRHLRSVHAQVRGPDGRERIIGPIQDITDQRRAEREVAAHVAVSESLTAWDSLEQGATTLMSNLARAMDFEIGVLWVPQDKVLIPRVFWHSSRTNASEFDSVTRQLRFPQGSGIPGQAWESRQPVSWARAREGESFERRGAGEMCSALAFPATHGEETLAVFEFYSREESNLTERLLRTLTGIGSEIGAFLGRRRGELGRARSLTPRELEVLQHAADGCTGREIAGHLVVSPSTIKTHFNHIYEKLGVSDRAAAVAAALRLGLIE